METNIVEKQNGEYTWEQIAEGLWKLLDDIDTASDMFKPEKNNFYKYAMKKCEERSKYGHSPDGYELRFNTRTAPIDVEVIINEFKALWEELYSQHHAHYKKEKVIEGFIRTTLTKLGLDKSPQLERLLVLATKWIPKDHHDWEELNNMGWEIKP